MATEVLLAGGDLERLAKLQELRDSGALSAEEFEAEKGRLLPNSAPEPSQAPQTGEQA